MQINLVKLVFILSFLCSSMWTGQSVHAQSDFYLDSIASIFLNFEGAGSFSGTKYRYNSDLKIEQIINDNYKQEFSYTPNKTSQKITYFTDQGLVILRESIFDNMGRMIVKNHFFDNQQTAIDSFFYENDNVVLIKKYTIIDNDEKALYTTENISYTSENLIESSELKQVDHTGQSPDIVILENFDYDQYLNVVEETKAYYFGVEFSEYDSTLYNYDLDNRLIDKWNISGGEFFEPYIRYFLYSYRDSTTIEDEFYFDSNNNPIRIIRSETQYCQHEYFQYDSLLRYRFLDVADSVLTLIETNHVSLSVTEDTIVHRNSRTARNTGGSLSSLQNSKSFYVKTPELVGISETQLPKLLLNPNPVLSGGTIRIPQTDLGYNMIVIYSLNGSEIQYIKSEKGRDFFNAPNEKGLYLVQLWQDNTPTSDIMKILVN